jgi:hypothetical protein
MWKARNEETNHAGSLKAIKPTMSGSCTDRSGIRDLEALTSPRRGFGIPLYRIGKITFVCGCPGVELATPEDRSLQRDPDF